MHVKVDPRARTTNAGPTDVFLINKKNVNFDSAPSPPPSPPSSPYQARLAQVVKAALGEDLGLIVEPHGAGRAKVDVLAMAHGEKREGGERAL